MAHEYAQLADLKATLDLVGETFADADITLALTAASRAIDNACNRRFWMDADAMSIRYYTPSRSRRLLEIDDLVTFTALDTDMDGDGTFETSWTLNTDFTFEPLNAVADGEPYTSLRVMPRGRQTLPGVFRNIAPRSVRLTGKFGWPAVPSEVQQATVILASRLMRRSREAPFGIVGFAMETGSAAANLAKNDPDVMMLLTDLIRPLIF